MGAETVNLLVVVAGLAGVAVAHVRSGHRTDRMDERRRPDLDAEAAALMDAAGPRDPLEHRDLTGDGCTGYWSIVGRDWIDCASCRVRYLYTHERAQRAMHENRMGDRLAELAGGDPESAA